MGYRSLDALQAAWSLDDLQAELVPQLAVRLLQEGNDSYQLRVLAGLDKPTYWDVIDPLDRLMADKKRTKLPFAQARRLLALDVIDRIQHGELSLREGLNQLSGLYIEQWEEGTLDALGTIPGLLDDLESNWSGRTETEIEAEVGKTLESARKIWEEDPTLRSTSNID